MDRLELSPIQAVSPTLAETMRVCRLRAGVSRTPGSYHFVLGNPKAWLGTAYHEVLDRIGNVAFSGDSCDSVAERLWDEAISAQYQRTLLHPLDRRFGLPVTWPGYYVVKASAFLRAQELTGNALDGGSTPRRGPQEAEQRDAIREQTLTAFDGRLVGRPDVIRAREILDYKSGSLFEQGEVTQTDVVKTSYVRQLRIYGFLVKETLGYWPDRGVLLPVAGAGVEIALDSRECTREATEAVAILDGYNTTLMTAATANDLASPSPSNCKWCPFKLFCNPFWKTATAAWSEQLDGAAVEGILEEPPMAIHGGAAVAVSLNIQNGSEEPRRVQLAPLHPNMQLASSIAAGDRVRLIGLRTRPDGSFIPSQRTVLARVDDLPAISLVNQR
jgi:PD-(D/E)XK nuclease superfamily